jgi:hypothetical protein
MSRHAITPRNPEQHQCWVGYDREPDSYFIYVARHLQKDERQRIIGEHNGHVVYHAGMTEARIDSVESLAELLEPYATLPREMYQVLRNDRLTERRTDTKQLTVKESPYASSGKR